MKASAIDCIRQRIKMAVSTTGVLPMKISSSRQSSDCFSIRCIVLNAVQEYAHMGRLESVFRTNETIHIVPMILVDGVVGIFD